MQLIRPVGFVAKQQRVETTFEEELGVTLYVIDESPDSPDVVERGLPGKVGTWALAINGHLTSGKMDW